MKILHATYRFGPEIIGGAEKYLWQLSTRLAALGADVTVATTTAREMRSPTRWNVFWTKGYEEGFEVRDGLKILRFPFQNQPRWLAGLYALPLERQFSREEWEFTPPETPVHAEGILGRGWYFEERTGDFVQRWTGPRAEFHISDNYIWQVDSPPPPPGGNGGEVYVNGASAGRFKIGKNPEYFSFKLPEPVNHARVEIQLARTRQPWKELRRLGIAVTSVVYNAGDHQREIPLHRHYMNALHGEKDALLEWLERRAGSRPERYCRYFDKVRGPISNGLARYLKRHAGEYDIVLGSCFPWWTAGAAVQAARAAGVRAALLPLAHMEDDYYHWNHYYKALGQADLTLALSDYSRDIFEGRYHANAHTIGAGIDPAEFENMASGGVEFRARHGLGNIPLVLFVGRKSGPKRWESLIRAVRIVNRTRPCRLIMAGPDEDSIPVNPQDALFLGKEDRGGILEAYAACDVFAMLSASESFGMVFTEAWMLEKPVIGNRSCGAVASLISDGADGFLCETEEETAQRILFLLENPNRARQMGAAGKKKTLERFTWDFIARRAMALYEDTVRAGGKRS